MGAPSSRTQSPAMDYNVSMHPHSLPSLLHCKARLPWRRELAVASSMATYKRHWLLLFPPEWKVLGGRTERAGSLCASGQGPGPGDADASLPRVAWSPTMV